MSKKELLSESQIRRFMTLANLQPLVKNVVKESQEQEKMEEAYQEESKMEEASHAKPDQAEGIVPEAEGMGMEDEGGDSEEGGAGLSDEDKKFLQDLASRLVGSPVEIEVEEGSADDEGEDEEDEGDEDDEAGMSDADVEMADDDEEDLEETSELSEEALVEAVLARVTARLVAEAKKGEEKKEDKKSAADKMAALRAKKKNKNSTKNSTKKPAGLKEATSAEGGGPLLKQGKNKYDVYKGHADMTMAKGDKGGKGGHSLETLTAKAEHTVTHGGKNLATMGGNKKKV
jgi:hypothetical protein